jgi:endonuclease/exonuclease/phosphatase family metal-dependent hydrolase
MAGRRILRRIFKIIFVSLNILVAVIFLVACLTPYLNPKNWWIIGFAGLVVPYLIIVLVLFLIFWLVFRPIWALLPFLALAIGWQQISVVFAWHPGAGFNKRKPENALRILDWNVQSFNGLSGSKVAKKLAPNELSSSVLKYEPDVICMQEFNTAENADNIALFKKQYPYHFFSRDYQRDSGRYLSGCIIFSKYPMIDTGRVKYPVAESLIYTDIVKGPDTIRIFTTHLQSFKFNPEDYDNMEKIAGQEDKNFSAARRLGRKMRLAFARRGIQANMVREAIDKSPYPVIICGDFNDVPNSYAYFRIKGDKQDAFLRKGFAIGRTFLALAPTLRIDYILADKNFEIRQFDLVDENLSDHLMLISDILVKK